MLGTALNWVLGLDAHPASTQQASAQLIGTVCLIVAAVLTVLQSYRLLERTQVWIVAVLLVSVMVAIFSAPVEWLRVLRGLVTPVVPAYDEWMRVKYGSIVASQSAFVAITVMMGSLGGAAYDYIGYLSFFREKGWGALGARAADGLTADRPAPAAAGAFPPLIELTEPNLARGREWLRPPLIDVFTGFFSVLVYAICFNVLGAAILHRNQIVPDGFSLLTPQVQFLTQVHPALKYVYQAGVLMAFWGTIYGAFEVYSRTAYECLRPLSVRLRSGRFGRFRLLVCLYQGLGGILLIWLVAEPIRIVEPAALVGTATCGLWCFAMIWADRRFLPSPLRMNWVWLILNVVAGTILTGFSIKAIVDYVGRLAGP